MRKKPVRVTQENFDLIKSMKQSGVRNHLIIASTGVSIATICNIANSETLEEYRQKMRAKEEKRCAKKTTKEKAPVKSRTIHHHAGEDDICAISEIDLMRIFGTINDKIDNMLMNNEMILGEMCRMKAEIINSVRVEEKPKKRWFRK